MVEFLAFYIIVGLVTNAIAIAMTGANPSGTAVMGAILMWPLVLYNIITSFFRKE